MNQVNTKSIFQSKQFMWAAIQALAGVITIFQTTYPQVGWLVIASSVVAMILRLKSEGTPVSITGGIKYR